MDVLIVSMVLLATLYFLITEAIPIDLTSVGLIAMLILTGLLTPAEAVAGFSNPAVVTVGAMFLISEGMIRTGSVSFLSTQVVRFSRGRARTALFILLVVVAVASAFMNNTAVVVLFIPVVMGMCCEFELSPAKFLIPVSYASILAGTCTLIGTSTNIIVSDLSNAYGYGPIGMFELSSVGLPIAAAGLAFLLLASFKIMPHAANPTCELDGTDARRYLAELHVPRGSDLVGREPAAALREKYPGFEVLELIRYSHVYYPERDTVTISPDDLLLVKGSANDLVAILRAKTADLTLSEKGLDFVQDTNHSILVEIIIPPQSVLRGRRLLDTEFYGDAELHTIAIKRRNLHYTEQNLRHIVLRTGDVLLVWCPEHRLERMRQDADVMIVEHIHHTIVHRRKARTAALIFGGFVLAASTGAASIMTCALTAVFLLAVTGCLQLRHAYRSLQPNVLLLIAATIGLGHAMQKTGASQLYAQGFLEIFSGMSPQWILGGILLLTSISTQLLSNNATAVLVLPVAVSTAVNLGVDPKPFIMAVCFGASACFATPIGYQTNLLVYGPGGYRFGDYFRLGIPLNLLILCAGTLLIPLAWPL